MRVLMVSEFYPPVRGGLEGHVRGLVTELVRTGHEVCVATLTRHPQHDPGVTTRTLASWVHRLPHADADRPFHPPLPEPLARHELKRLVESWRPDVVHGHNWLAVSAATLRRRVPLVITAHDYALVCQLRTLFDASGQRCAGPGLGKCVRCAGQAYGYTKSTLLAAGTPVGRALLRPDALIAVSRCVAGRVASAFPGDIDVIPNFHDDRVVADAQGTDDLPARFVLFAGDPGRHKGLDLILDLWAGADPPPAPLVVATSRPYAAAVPEHVHLRRFSPAQMREVLRRATVCVVPSRWDDPAPTIVLEAMAAGVPVVASAVGGIPEMVDGDVSGVLVPPGDQLALRAALARVLDDGAWRRELGRSGRRRAERYALSAVTCSIVGVYERVLRAAA